MVDRKDFSIKGQIQKRKTQEILRVAEAQKVARANGVSSADNPKSLPQMAEILQSASPSTGSSRPIQADAKRTTQRAAVSPSAIQTQQVPRLDARTGPRVDLSPRRRQQVIVVVAALMILFTIGIMAWIASNQPLQANMPTYSALPAVSGDQVVTYLQQAGLPVENIVHLANPEKPWHAIQQINFSIHLDSSTRHLALLVYDQSASQKLDYGTLVLDAHYNKWQFLENANTLLLMSTPVDSNLKMLLESHLTSFLEAPYRSYLPTPTIARQASN